MASTVSGYVGRINPGDGTNYALGSTAYGVCDTAAATAAKTVDMTGFELVEGATVHVKFTYANTADSPTLSINSSTAKPIVGTWAAADVCTLTYDGTSWVINNQTLSNNLNLPIKVGTGQGSLIENDLSLSLAAGAYAHSEGYWTSAAGDASHAEGLDANAFGAYSHAEGMHTVATHAAQHVFGRANIGDNSSADSSQIGNYIEIVGNGADSANRSNARTLDWDGNEWLAGTLTLSPHEGQDSSHLSSYFVQTPVDTSVTALSDAFYRGYAFLDVDGTDRAYISFYERTSGIQGIQLETRRIVNNSSFYNSLALALDDTGTPEVILSSGAAAAWRSAIGAVSKTGDTMAGNLNIMKTDVDLKSATNGISSEQWGGFGIQDKNTYLASYLSTDIKPNGDVATGIWAYNRNTSGTQIGSGYFKVWVNKSGTVSYELANPSALRSAISAMQNDPASIELRPASGATNGGFIDFHYAGSTADYTARIIEESARLRVQGKALYVDSGMTLGSALPAGSGGTGQTSLQATRNAMGLGNTTGALPIANGGTGQTGISATTTIADIVTAASGCTVTTAQYVVFGKVAMLYVVIKKTAAVTSATANTTLGTVVSGKRPKYHAGLTYFSGGQIGYLNTDGTVHLHGAISANTEVKLVGTYILA